MSLVKRYISLVKPERTLTNVITAIAGYSLGAHLHFHLLKLASLVIGSTLIIASACILNNYFDRFLDLKMKRTSKRALATRSVSNRVAISLALALVAVGFAVLSLTNLKTMLIGAIGFFGYVVFYGYSKRISPYGTLIGTVPGAASIVAGYTAATNQFDSTALVLLLILVSWQMAHFYAISLYRLDDYRAANIPVWPLKYGLKSTKISIALFIAIYLVSCSLLSSVGHIGLIYFIPVLLVNLYWLGLGIKLLYTNAWQQQSRQVFSASLSSIIVFSVLVSVGSVI